MFTLHSDKLQLIFDPFYSKQETIYPPYNKRYEQKIFIDYLYIQLKDFQEKWDQVSKQQEV